MQAGAAAAPTGAVTILPPLRRVGSGRVAASRSRAWTRPSVLARAGWFPWLPVWLAAGIGLWFAFGREPGPQHYASAGVLAALGMAGWFLAPRWGQRTVLPWAVIDALRLGGLALAVAACGFGLAGLRSAEVAAPVLQWRYYGPVEGRVVEVDRSARDRIRVTLDQVVLRDLSAARTPRRVRMSLNDPDGGQVVPQAGTRVMLTGHLGPPPPPSAPDAFDFRRQAWFEGLGAIGYSRTPIMTVAPAKEGGTLWLARLRRDLSAAMQADIGGQEGAVASALMTGDRSGIAEATNALMRDANLYHIVSISGLHMSMLAGFLYAALRIALSALAAASGRGLALPVHKLAAAVALGAAAFYMALSDGGVATERAFVMVAVMLGAILVDRRAISLRTVALAALILLVLSPEALTQAGFQMSFAATVALILSIEPWGRIAPHLPRLLRPVAMLVVSSLVAGLATAPLAAAHFGRMADYGLLANLLVVPVMGAVVMPAGVIAALLGPIGLAQPALWVMGLGTGWMLDVARFVAGIDGAVTMVPAPPAVVLPLLGAGGVAMALGGAGMLLPRGALRGAGVALLIVALGLWVAGDQPAVLVGPEAEAVGLMTAAGRALSKPKGGSFAVTSWLADDGDTATQADAAARPGWDGPAGIRRAWMEDGRALVHLTGRGAGAALADACSGGAVVVAAIDAPRLAPGARRDCRLIDLASLSRSGALAIDAGGQVRSVRDATGTRAWSPMPRARTPRDRTGKQGAKPQTDARATREDGEAAALRATSEAVGQSDASRRREGTATDNAAAAKSRTEGADPSTAHPLRTRQSSAKDAAIKAVRKPASTTEADADRLPARRSGPTVTRSGGSSPTRGTPSAHTADDMTSMD